MTDVNDIASERRRTVPFPVIAMAWEADLLNGLSVRHRGIDIPAFQPRNYVGGDYRATLYSDDPTPFAGPEIAAALYAQSTSPLALLIRLQDGLASDTIVGIFPVVGVLPDSQREVIVFEAFYGLALSFEEERSLYGADSSSWITHVRDLCLRQNAHIEPHTTEDGVRRFSIKRELSRNELIYEVLLRDQFSHDYPVRQLEQFVQLLSSVVTEFYRSEG